MAMEISDLIKVTLSSENIANVYSCCLLWLGLGLISSVTSQAAVNITFSVYKILLPNCRRPRNENITKITEAEPPLSNSRREGHNGVNTTSP
jgi:hypothetical protein